MEEIGSAAMLAAKRLAGVAPEVNLREHVTHMPLASVNKTAHSGFKTQRRHHQKYKIGVSVTYVLQIFFYKNGLICDTVIGWNLAICNGVRGRTHHRVHSAQHMVHGANDIRTW